MIPLLGAVFLVALVGVSFTMLGAFGLVWLANLLDRWLD